MPVPKWIVGTSAGSAAKSRRMCGATDCAIVVRRERSGPGVEDLERLRSRRHLRGEVGAGGVGQSAHERLPGARLGVHERLHLLERSGGPSLDQVGRQRERSAGEPDERDRAPFAHEPDRLEEGRHPLLGVEGPQALHVARGRDRLEDDGADALADLEREAQALERQRDVGEQDRRVDPQPLDRLERHLGAEIGDAGDLQEAVPLPHRAVLGERAARLAHEPHRRPVDGLGPAGLQEPERAIARVSPDGVAHVPPSDAGIASRAASRAASISASPWASVRNQASKGDGGNQMPRSSMAWKKRAKAAGSPARASS